MRTARELLNALQDLPEYVLDKQIVFNLPQGSLDPEVEFCHGSVYEAENLKIVNNGAEIFLS